MTLSKAYSINEAEIEAGRSVGGSWKITTDGRAGPPIGKLQRETYDAVKKYLINSRKMIESGINNSDPIIAKSAKAYIKANKIKNDAQLIGTDFDTKTVDLKIDGKGVTVTPDNDKLFDKIFISNAELGIKG